jgi:two-component system, chemotaxis family, CheB/CheR fusion protein
MTGSRRRKARADGPRRPSSSRVKLSPIAADFAIVGIGASAGGLDASKKLLDALPSDTGMAFVLIQHLDPRHESMMVELLTGHTRMTVGLAKDGAAIKPDHVYLIPPGHYLAIESGVLRLSVPRERHGARLPFDFFLRSLAEDAGPRAVGVVLSGSGADGSLGSKAIKERGGLVIAQSPEEAEYAAMPLSTIETGATDLVLPVPGIATVLAELSRGIVPGKVAENVAASDEQPTWLTDIIDFLRTKTTHRFAAYKAGTLRRRIERRIAMAVGTDTCGYLDLLRKNPAEVQLLAKDLLINVTSFFRDPNAFAILAKDMIPGLLGARTVDHSLRIWVAGCSSGEETYSIAILCAEAIAASEKPIRLQIFASDVDEEAIAIARSGLYPRSIEMDVSPRRLSRFFIKDDQGYRVCAELRNAVVFAVQDILVDPPFSRLDMISCRNLLIYLRPDAQEKVLQLFHFALREGGILFLGSAETTRGLDTRFAPISKTERFYRRLARTRPWPPYAAVGTGALKGATDNLPAQWRGKLRQSAPQAPGSGEMMRRILVEAFAPASVLINAEREVLYHSGRTDRYLHLPPGEPTQDVLAMARMGLRAKLAKAIEQARETAEPVTMAGARIIQENGSMRVGIGVQRAGSSTETLFLVSFVDEAEGPQKTITGDVPSEDASKIDELERELDAARNELEAAVRDLATAREEERAVSEEAMSVNEEYQSTNEELLTSKEELQSLNEELTALNVQLQETLERQRSTSDDLQNILESSSVATLFLDRGFNIRFFTPAAKSLFKLIASDIGRPLADLAPLSSDTELLTDARRVLETSHPIGREVDDRSDKWSMRRILPYRTHGGEIGGVVITYTDISEMKVAARQIEAAYAYSDSIINTMRQPLVVFDSELLVVSANAAFFDAFATDAGRAVGRRLAFLDEGATVDPGLRAFLDNVRSTLTPVEGYVIEAVLPMVGRRRLLLNATRIRGDNPRASKILLAIDDITERSLVAGALEISKRQAEQASLGKSRFLAAASHDLRQPLQTMSLLHGLLAARAADTETLKLVARLDSTISVMSGILNTLLDINQLEAGIVEAVPTSFSVNGLLERLRAEFADCVERKGLRWRVVPCSKVIHSDQRLLAAILRNLLSNAVKYTTSGKVLLGCRRRGQNLRIEVCDSGIGIPAGKTDAIFEEFHQLDNPARERGRGLGLGLTIARRLADLLGHRVTVDSIAGRGSIFAIEIPPAPRAAELPVHDGAFSVDGEYSHSGVILIVEDDPEVGGLMGRFLEKAGYQVSVAADGTQAVARITDGGVVPDLVIVDFNLPGPLNGLEAIARIKQERGNALPAIILTGDITTSTLQQISGQNCFHLIKPVKADVLLGRIGALLSNAAASKFKEAPFRPERDNNRGTIFLIDDDPQVCEAMRDLLEANGWAAETYSSCEAFQKADHAGRRGCVLVDAVMPGMGGLELLRRLKPSSHRLPAIMVTGNGDIHMAVGAMTAGALNFIEKPVDRTELLSSIEAAFDLMKGASTVVSVREAAVARIATLTPRQRQIMDLVLAGHPSKNIAADLKISQRTVENHRAAIMKKAGATSLPALIRVGIIAA